MDAGSPAASRCPPKSRTRLRKEDDDGQDAWHEPVDDVGRHRPRIRGRVDEEHIALLLASHPGFPSAPAAAMSR